jgi:hypothetical protein
MIDGRAYPANVLALDKNIPRLNQRAGIHLQRPCRMEQDRRSRRLPRRQFEAKARPRKQDRSAPKKEFGIA